MTVKNLTAPAATEFGAIAPVPGLSPELSKLTASALRFLIRTFPVPPFLLPIYQAASIEYGVPWQVLAAINEIETDFGRDLAVSSAGAVGWMQFLPSTWARFGVNADGRGKPNPYDPVDAIFAAARYLHAAGAGTNMSKAIFAYNHASWYVDSVELRARLLQVLPAGLVDGLFGLMQASYPIAGHLGADATRAPGLERIGGQPAAVMSGPAGARVIAGADARIVAIGDSAQLGHYVTLEDSYGDQITYGGLGSVPLVYPELTPQVETVHQLVRRLGLGRGHFPTIAKLPAATRLSVTAVVRQQRAGAKAGAARASGQTATAASVPATAGAPLVKERLFARPTLPGAYAAGGRLQLQLNVRSYLASTHHQLAGRASDVLARQLRLTSGKFTLAPLSVGATVAAGTVIGRLAGAPGSEARMLVEIRPTGASNAIDPRAIVSSWMLLGQLTGGTGVINGSGEGTAFDSRNDSLGQLLMADTATLEQAVLSDSRVTLDVCERTEIADGQVGRRALAVLEYLSYSGLAPTVSGLGCGAPAGSAPSFEITAINGTSVLGHQRAGGIVDLTDRQLLALQGSLRPSRIISLRRYPWQSTALSLPDHAADIEVDFSSAPAVIRHQRSLARQWNSLAKRLDQLSTVS